ncbi:MAG: type II secretion system F family protein [Actinobacteria bacterium]|nr:type II secretion system F family protein [Actinomycetota bacterium]
MITEIEYPAVLTGAAALAWCLRRVKLPGALQVLEMAGRYGAPGEELKSLGKRLEALRIPLSAELATAGKRSGMLLIFFAGAVLLAGGQKGGALFLLALPMAAKAPEIALSFLEKRRKEAIQAAFPLVVEQVKVYAGAVGYYDAIKVVARSWHGVLGRELALLSAEMELVGLIEAVDNFARRCNVAEMKDFARIISVEQTTGADISEILSNYSKVSRQRKASKIKRWIKIQPVLMSLLPGVLIVIFIMMFIIPMVGTIINQLNAIK